LQQKTGSAVSQNVLAERAQPVAEVDSANQKDTKRRAALCYAAAMGNSKMVGRLLAYGAKTDDTALYTTTSLGEAVSEGHVDVVRILIAAGANPDVGENKHYPSLSIITRKQNIPVIRGTYQGWCKPGFRRPGAF
jgi:ankyrin repeat protein